jgi:sugar fermentation stimulation protein A
MDELATAAASGARAVVLFLIQIGSATGFAPARDIDPGYAAAFDRACRAGVEALAYACAITTESIALGRRIPIIGS